MHKGESMAKKSKKPKVPKNFSKKQIADFKKEMKKPLIDTQDLFYEIINKDPEDVSKDELRILIYRSTYLADKERFKFRELLVRENLTENEELRFRRILPDKFIYKYFPAKKDVEEHYKSNFLGGRDGNN